MHGLLALYPHLRRAPLPGALTAPHCAAQAGNLMALQSLLAKPAGPVDGAVFREGPPTHNFLIGGLLEGEDDLYLFQPPLTKSSKLRRASPSYTVHPHPIRSGGKGAWDRPLG